MRGRSGGQGRTGGVAVAGEGPTVPRQGHRRHTAVRGQTASQSLAKHTTQAGVCVDPRVPIFVRPEFPQPAFHSKGRAALPAPDTVFPSAARRRPKETLDLPAHALSAGMEPGSRRGSRGFRERRQGYPLGLWNLSRMFAEPTQGLVLGAPVLLTGHVATFLGCFQHQQTWEGAAIIPFHSSVWKPLVCFLSMGWGSPRGDTWGWAMPRGP